MFLSSYLSTDNNQLFTFTMETNYTWTTSRLSEKLWVDIGLGQWGISGIKSLLPVQIALQSQHFKFPWQRNRNLPTLLSFEISSPKALRIEPYMKFLGPLVEPGGVCDGGAFVKFAPYIYDDCGRPCQFGLDGLSWFYDPWGSLFRRESFCLP